MINIIHNSGLIISKDTKLSDLEGVDFVDADSPNDDYRHFSIHDFNYEGITLSIGLLYQKGVLERIQLTFIDSELYGSGWSDYSEKRERRRAKDVERWLSTKGIKNGSYDWGEVWIGFEGKTPFGGAVISYE